MSYHAARPPIPGAQMALPLREAEAEEPLQPDPRGVGRAGRRIPSQRRIDELFCRSSTSPTANVLSCLASASTSEIKRRAALATKLAVLPS